MLIAAYGEEGIRRVSALTHPEVEGVEYIVSWQQYRRDAVPDTLRARKDFIILFEDSSGLSNNRNNALRHSSAPLVLISDDDVSYTGAHIQRILKAFEDNPKADVLTFRYESETCPKKSPEFAFDLSSPPKGYYVSSIEIALNMGRIKSKAGFRWQEMFNPAYGLGGTLFISGEEDILMEDLRRAGFQGRYLPEAIATHSGPTTSERLKDSPELVEAKGAVVSYIHPFSWPLRMAVHALRARRPFIAYCRNWIAGVTKRKNS